MDNLNRYLRLILSWGTLVLFLAGTAMVQADGNQLEIRHLLGGEDGQLGAEDWSVEYQEGTDERSVSGDGYERCCKECPITECNDGYCCKKYVNVNLGGSYGCCCNGNGRYTVVLFNIAMGNAQSYGGSVFEYHSHRRNSPVQTQVNNNILSDNLPGANNNILSDNLPGASGTFEFYHNVKEQANTRSDSIRWIYPLAE